MNALFLSIIYSAVVPQSIICGSADSLYYYYYLKFTSVVMQSDAKLATTSVCPQNNCSNKDLQ